MIVAGLAAAGWFLAGVLRETPASAEGAAAESASGAGGGLSIAPPEAAAAVQDAARAYEASGEVGKAEAVLRDAVATYVEDQPLRLAYADMLMRRERFEAAYEQWTAALAVGPRSAEVEFGAGLAASRLGQTTRAVEHFAAAQTAAPGNSVFPLYLATEQLRIGRLDEATANLVRVTVLDADNATAWGALAEVALRQNRAALAAQHARKARELRPEEPAWRVLEARALKRSGEAEPALLLLTGLPEQAQRRPETARTIAECLGMLGRDREAAAAMHAASQAAGEDASLAFDAAVWAERAGDAEAARSLAARAATLGHAGARAMLTRLGDGARP